VELVGQELLPEREERLSGIGRAPESGQRGQELSIAQGELGLPVAALHLGDGGQRPAVQLEVELAHPHGQTGHVALDAAHELGQRDLAGAGAALEIGHAARDLEHLNGGAAAPVAVAVAAEAAVLQVLVLEEVPGVGHALGRQVHVVHIQVGDDRGAVEAAPGERVEGEAGGVVPRHLGRAEEVDATALQDLRERRRVAEDVGQP